MMTAHRQHDLPTAINKLHNTISALIDPKPVAVTRDNGTTTITWLDPLHTQLMAAVNGQKSAGRHGGNQSTPIWAAALDLLDQLDTHTREWVPQWPIPDLAHPEPTAVTRLRTLAATHWSVDDTPHITTITHTLDAYTREVTDLLTPEPTIYLMAPGKNAGAAACTACGTTWVWRKDPTDNNRPVRSPALKVTRYGCQCQHCHASWEPGALRMLAAALGYPLPTGVLE
jgi:hypothetical protein